MDQQGRRYNKLPQYDWLLKELCEEFRLEIAKEKKDALHEIQEEMLIKEDQLRQREQQLEERAKQLAIKEEQLMVRVNQLEVDEMNFEEQRATYAKQLGPKIQRLMEWESELREQDKKKEEDEIQLNKREESLKIREAYMESYIAMLEKATTQVSEKDEELQILRGEIGQQEQDLLQKQDMLGKLEFQVKIEQQQNQILHSRIQKEQEKMMEEMKIREENLHKRELILEKREDDVKKNLQKLVEKKNLVDLKLKQLKEIETTTKSLEEELHSTGDTKSIFTRLNDIQNNMKFLESMKHDLQQKNSEVETRFQEVQAMKREAKHWQKKVEKEFNDKMNVFLKDKEDLENQKQDLIGLQQDVEKARTKLIDQMMIIDEA